MSRLVQPGSGGTSARVILRRNWYLLLTLGIGFAVVTFGAESKNFGYEGRPWVQYLGIALTCVGYFGFIIKESAMQNRHPKPLDPLGSVESTEVQGRG